MIKLCDNGKTNFYFDTTGMMLDRSDWNKHGQGDALWRTALALIASIDGTDNSQIIHSILKCLETNKKSKYRFARHPLRVGMDSSRDQNIMGMIALKYYAPLKHKEVKNNLAFWISPLHGWLDAWFWAKERYLVWRIISFYKFFLVYFDKSYSKHLFCWMIWDSRQRMPLLRKLMIYVTHKDNYLCRALLGDKFTSNDMLLISRLKPMNDFRWQRDIPWNEGRKLTPEESEYNTLDIDVLEAII